MQSCIKGRNYMYLLENEKFPSKINKTKTDKILRKLKENLKSLKETYKELYEDNYEINNLLREELEHTYHVLNLDDGECYEIDDCIEEIEALEEKLKTQDDTFPKPEEITTLEDIGFRCERYPVDGVDFYYEKTLEDNKEKEVIEEIYRYKKQICHRERTTLWAYKPGCKYSENISYKDLKTNSKLNKVIQNTIKYWERNKK